MEAIRRNLRRQAELIIDRTDNTLSTLPYSSHANGRANGVQYYMGLVPKTYVSGLSLSPLPLKSQERIAGAGAAERVSGCLPLASMKYCTVAQVDV